MLQALGLGVSEPAKALLDASAIVALVFKERGYGVVERIVKAGIAATSPTGLVEVLGVCRRKGYKGTRDELVADLAGLGLEVTLPIEVDGPEMALLLERAAELAAKGGKHAAKLETLSLGDAACLAAAVRLGTTAVFSDGTWELLEVRVLPAPTFA